MFRLVLVHSKSYRVFPAAPPALPRTWGALGLSCVQKLFAFLLVEPGLSKEDGTLPPFPASHHLRRVKDLELRNSKGQQGTGFRRPRGRGQA